jgi:hypothetical protein
MNPLQEQIARWVGIDSEISAVREAAETAQQNNDDYENQLTVLQGQQLEVAETLEHLINDNAMLQRQIEDLDYINLYELGGMEDVIPNNRRETLKRLRRLRHDNPLAKQAVKLILRFTLGKGVQWVLARDPEEAPADTGSGLDSQPHLGVVPDGATSRDNGAPPPTKLVQLPRYARSRQEQAPTDDPIRDIIQGFWDDPDNQLAFTTHNGLKRWLDDVVTDGEKFYGCFIGSVAPYLKVSEFPVEEIVQIIYSPDNRLKPVFYKRTWQPMIYDGESDMYKPDGSPKSMYYVDYRISDEELAELRKKIKIPQRKINADARILHVMINEIWTKHGKRGLSDLFASREWFKVFREFMEGRASINAAAQAISFIRKIKGGPTQVAQFGGKFGGVSVGDSGTGVSEIRKLTRPVAGAIYDTNPAVDLEWMKADTGANNAKEDARLLLATAGAGMGTMLHYFGEGGDANLATAQSMELPMVKSYEDWQQFTEDFLMEWFRYVLKIALEDDEEVQAAMKRLGTIFPPIISQDVVKYTTSWSQIVRDIAPNNPAVQRQAIRAVLSIMGVPNIDAMMEEIEQDMEKAQALKEEMRQNLLSAGNPLDENGKPKPPVVGQIPNAGLDPRTKALVAGKVAASNGTKPA